MNSIFINFGTFFDINKNATDKYISYWINNLFGFVISKKIISDTMLHTLLSY